MEVDPERDARRLTGVEGTPRIGDVGAQGLVTQDVLAGTGGSHHLIGVEQVWSGDEDRFDFAVGQHLVVVGVCESSTELPCEVICPTLVPTHPSHEITRRLDKHRGRHRGSDDVPDADDAPAERFSHFGHDKPRILAGFPLRIASFSPALRSGRPFTQLTASCWTMGAG